MKRIVVDASVVLKWYLPDEEYGNIAIEILDKYVSYEVELLAPSLLEYEVLNGLLIARKRGRIPDEMMFTAIEGLLSLEIEHKDISFFYPEVIRFSESFDLSAYGASYLAMANNESTHLVTADKNLYNKVNTDLKWVRWLGDFSF